MTPTKDDALAALDNIAAVELIAKWMIHHGFTTGHSDTIEGLLNELSWQIAEIKTEGDDGGHATEKQPAAPAQIDAGELEAAIDHCESVCNTSIRDFVLVPDEEFWLILKAARAHLEKSKGGV